MNYEAVVFDLDGTLTDSAPGILRCLEYTFEKLGRPAPEEKVLRKFLGPPLVRSFMDFCGMSEEEAVRARDAYRERYRALGWKENRVFPGIRSLLTALKKAGARLSIATGKQGEASGRIARAFWIDHYFDAIVGTASGDHFAEKKDLIARSLEGFSGRAVMIGDRASDITAAAALGMDSVAVLWGYGERAELEGAKPTHLVETVEELASALGAELFQSRGFFISLEGNDGCGKSTQADLLHESLARFGFDTVKTREPGGSYVAEKIREILLDRANTGMHDMTEAMLYAAARAQHVRDVIRPALQRGKLVLSDRYVDSSVAYQGAGRGLGMELVARINEPAVDGCLPDLTVLLDIDAQDALRRRERASRTDRIEMLEDSFHLRVAKAYRELLHRYADRIRPVDATGTPDEVAERVLGLVHGRMAEAGLI